MNMERAIDKDRLRRLKLELRRTLMQLWDPIGVKDDPMAADEYDMYLGEIYGLLSRHVTDVEMAEHLRKIETERMGFAEQQTTDRLDVARALKALSLE